MNQTNCSKLLPDYSKSRASEAMVMRGGGALLDESSVRHGSERSRMSSTSSAASLEQALSMTEMLLKMPLPPPSDLSADDTTTAANFKMMMRSQRKDINNRRRHNSSHVQNSSSGSNSLPNHHNRRNCLQRSLSCSDRLRRSFTERTASSKKSEDPQVVVSSFAATTKMNDAVSDPSHDALSRSRNNKIKFELRRRSSGKLDRILMDDISSTDRLHQFLLDDAEEEEDVPDNRRKRYDPCMDEDNSYLNSNTLEGDPSSRHSASSCIIPYSIDEEEDTEDEEKPKLKAPTSPRPTPKNSQRATPSSTSWPTPSPPLSSFKVPRPPPPLTRRTKSETYAKRPLVQRQASDVSLNSSSSKHAATRKPKDLDRLLQQKANTASRHQRRRRRRHTTSLSPPPSTSANFGFSRSSSLKLTRLNESTSNLLDASNNDLLQESFRRESHTTASKRNSLERKASRNSLLLDQLLAKKKQQKEVAAMTSTHQNAQWTATAKNNDKTILSTPAAMPSSPSTSTMASPSSFSAKLAMLASLNKKESKCSSSSKRSSVKMPLALTTAQSTTALLGRRGSISSRQPPRRKVSFADLNQSAHEANPCSSQHNNTTTTRLAMAMLKGDDGPKSERLELLQSKLTSLSSTASSSSHRPNQNFEWSTASSGAMRKPPSFHKKDAAASNPFLTIINSPPTAKTLSQQYKNAPAADFPSIPKITTTSGNKAASGLAPSLKLNLDPTTAARLQQKYTGSTQHQLLLNTTTPMTKAPASAMNLHQMSSMISRSTSAAKLQARHHHYHKHHGSRNHLLHVNADHSHHHHHRHQESSTTTAHHSFVTGSRIRRYKSSGTLRAS